MLHYLEKALQAPQPTRRGFLKLSAAAAGGLMIGLSLPKSAAAAEGDAIMPFVELSADGSVKVICKHLDKGQGIATGLATLVADELDVPAEVVSTAFAPADAAVYKNLLFGVQGTGGSTGIANAYQQYREAGAALRMMLKSAAAKAWGVDPSAVTADLGVLSAGDNRATYGEMAAAAVAEPVPETVTVKSPEDWRYIGKDFPRMDLPQKTTGSVDLFGMDIQLEDMLVAVTARSPRFGGTVTEFDATAAKEVAGVVDVIAVPQGIVVLATSTWAAMQGREALDVSWNFADAENRGTDTLRAEYKALSEEAGLPAMVRGDAEGKLADAAATVEVEFEFPYLAHTPMEPLDITVLYDGAAAEFWTGSQIQTFDQGTASAVLGLPPEKVQVHTLWAGGSFGRRAIYDAHYTAEAAMIAKAYLAASGKARPIKLVWSREDDVRGGYYRPMHLHKVKAGVGADGKISGWQHRIVGQGIMIGTPFETFAVKDGVDSFLRRGRRRHDLQPPRLCRRCSPPPVGVPVLWWRAVGHTHTAYAMETTMDRLAEAAGQDPVDFRLAHLDADPALGRRPPPRCRKGRLVRSGARGPLPRCCCAQELQLLLRTGRRGVDERRWHGEGREGRGGD